MKKVMCVFLSIVLCVTALFSGTVLVSVASTEYIKTDKSVYESGEMVKISYSFDDEESDRFICVYRNGEAIYNNLMYAMSASSLSNEGTLVPSSSVVWTWHGGGPTILTKPLDVGNYIIKVMYLTGVSTNAPDYVEGAKSAIISTFTVVENTGSANPMISATKTELEAGEDLEIAFDGVTNELGENTLQIKLENSAGTVTTWNLWDGSTEYAGLNGTVIYTETLPAGTYTATLVCSDPDFVLGNDEIQITVKAPEGGTIATNKSEYESGEMVKISYSFDDEESGRFICVYKGEAIYNNLMYAMSASSLFDDGTWGPSSNVIWTWHGGGPTILTKPLDVGNYIIKVMYLNGVSTNAPDYVEGAKSAIISTFTVVENTGSANPMISATKTELEAGEDLEIAFDGVTNELGENTLQIKLESSVGTVTTWNLWDGSTEYAGLNGTVIYTETLPAGTYTATLVCSDPDFLLGNDEIQITVKAPEGGTVSTNKFEYKSGEMVKLSYNFDEADSSRRIGIYKDEGTSISLMYAADGTSTFDDGIWVPSNNVVWNWQAGGPSIMTRPLPVGNYIVKVVYIEGDALQSTSYVEGALSNITARFTVVENTGSANPTISATKTELEAGEDLEIAFDGVTNELGENTLQIKLENSVGTVTTWNLWDGSTEYAGLNGTVMYTDFLPAGTYTVTLICSSADITLGNSQVTLKVNAASLMAQPELKESITMHYTVMLGEHITGTPIMKYVYNGEEFIVDGALVGNNTYTFALEDILPQDMGKIIDAYISIDGTEITRYEGYSVRQYCLNQLAKTDDANLKALLVALLNYGTQAQGYFGSTDTAVNDGLDQSLLTNYLAGKDYDASNPDGSVATPVTGTNSGDYVWKAATLGLYDTIKIRVKFQATSVDGLKVIVNGTNDYTEFVSAGTDLWYVYIPVYAADFADSLVITFQNGTETVGATLTYSVNTYVKYAMDNGTVEVKPLVEAIYYYGVLASERA